MGPKGKVYAVDVQQSMLDLTKAAVAEHKLSNVEYVLATDSSPRLPERSVDLVFIAYAYHEFGDPDAMMAAIRRALKPGGRVVILEYAKESNIAPASPLHKMSFEEIRREIEPMGFVVDQLLDFLPVQHGVDLHNKVAGLFDRKSGRPTYPCGRTVPLVNSLLTAIVRANGDALVLHAGERPYVVAPSGQLELASRALTLEAVKGMLNELLPVEARQVARRNRRRAARAWLSRLRAGSNLQRRGGSRRRGHLD